MAKELLSAVLLLAWTTTMSKPSFAHQRPYQQKGSQQTPYIDFNEEQIAMEDNNTGLEVVPLQIRPHDNAKATERTVQIQKATDNLLRVLGYIDAADGGNNTIINHHGSGLPESYNEQLNLPEPATEQYGDDNYTTTMETSKVKTGIPLSMRRHNYPLQSLNKTTKLYPVGRLWDRHEQGRQIEDDVEQRTGPTIPGTRPAMPGIMAILDAAFSCLWSGLGFECLSLKVVPMFRAMMGIPPIFPFPPMSYLSTATAYDEVPYYILPRNTDVAKLPNHSTKPPLTVVELPDQVGNRNQWGVHRSRSTSMFELVTGRRRRVGVRLIKMAMIVLATIKTLAVPALSILSILSGKAVVLSLAAVVLTMVFGWSAITSDNVAANRRVLDHRDRLNAWQNSYYNAPSLSSYSSI